MIDVSSRNNEANLTVSVVDPASLKHIEKRLAELQDLLSAIIRADADMRAGSTTMSAADRKLVLALEMRYQAHIEFATAEAKLIREAIHGYLDPADAGFPEFSDD